MINFFVSSTFIDMQYERDALREKVFPTLNHYANSMGESVAMTDLRWGINTTYLNLEESSKEHICGVFALCYKDFIRRLFCLLHMEMWHILLAGKRVVNIETAECSE